MKEGWGEGPSKVGEGRDCQVLSRGGFEVAGLSIGLNMGG